MNVKNRIRRNLNAWKGNSIYAITRARSFHSHHSFNQLKKPRRPLKRNFNLVTQEWSLFAYCPFLFPAGKRLDSLSVLMCFAIASFLV